MGKKMKKVFLGLYMVISKVAMMLSHCVVSKVRAKVGSRKFKGESVVAAMLPTRSEVSYFTSGFFHRVRQAI